MDPYLTANDVLTDLRAIYKDPDKPRNYRRAYIEIAQGMKKFSDFFIEFRRLSTFLGYGESQCMDDLRDKISPRLQAALSTQMVQPDSLSTMKDYLIRVDNEQRAARAAKDRRWSSMDLQSRASKEEAKIIKRVVITAPAGFPIRQPTTPPSSGWRSSTSPQRSRRSLTSPQHLSSSGWRIPTSLQRLADEKEGNCYTCHCPGHLARECSR